MQVKVAPKVVLAGIACLCMAACTTDPYTGEDQAARAAIGAAVGAAVGAVAGAISTDSSKERRKRALIGAGVGALAGGAVGAYMDAQEARLRERLRNTGVAVVRKGNDITLSMPGNLTFATDSAEIRPDFYEVLRSVALVMDEYDKTIIDVVGHTDSTGSDAHNLALSERRAESVAGYLRSQGVRDIRIETVGAGERYPIADNATAEGRQANRRVELTLEPLVTSSGGS